MLQAIFHSNRGEKSALLLIQDKISFAPIPVYVRRGFTEGLEPGDSITIPAGYKVVDWNTITKEDGTEIVLKTLSL